MSSSLRAMFGHIDACDWRALAGVFHPDIAYERPGFPPFLGLERVLRFYREERTIVSGRHDIHGIVVEGDQAACWGHVRGTLSDGSEFDEHFAEIYVLEEGKIRKRRSYFFRPAV